MSHTAEEAAHLNAIRSWWQRYGTWVTSLVILALSSAATWQLWHSHVLHRRHQASTQFDQLEQAIHAKAWSRAADDLTSLQQQAPQTLYASMGSVVYAKALLQHNTSPNQRSKARQAFQWACEHAQPALIHHLVALQHVHAVCTTTPQNREATLAALKQLEGLTDSLPILATVERAGCHEALHQRRATQRDVDNLRKLLLTTPGTAPKGLINALNLWLLSHHA